MEVFDDELRDIKREIIESRGLIIKTNNLTNALAADIKSIAKRQQGYERRMFFNSATAYVVFVLIAFVVLKFAWDARVDAIEAETRQTRAKAARLEKQLREAEQREEERAQAESKAFSLYQLAKQEKYKEYLQSYETLDMDLLTKTEAQLFQDEAERARNVLSIQAYQAGLEHVRVGRWHEAEQAFRDSLQYKSNAAHSTAARYHQAEALRHLGRQKEAIPILLDLSKAAADKEYLDDATYLLAQCLVDIKAWNDAKTALRSFVRRFPNSPYINDVRTQLAELNLKH